MKKLISCCLIMPFICGCSLLTTGPGDPPDWDKLAPTIQTRVRYVAAFTFQMKQVKPHKDQICQIANDISNMLDNYNDREGSFEAVRDAVMDIVSQIPDETLRGAATVFVDMILTEAFNYAWKHYEEMINQDKVQTTILIARSIGNGLKEACAMSSLSAGGSSGDIFTVR